MMAIKSEVFGSCVEEIYVSVEIENRDAWLCCVGVLFRLIWEGKAVQDCVRRWMIMPGIGGRFWFFCNY